MLAPIRIRVWETEREKMHYEYVGSHAHIGHYGEVQGNNIAMRLVFHIDNDEQRPVYAGDIVTCFDNGAEDNDWGLDKKHTGVVVDFQTYAALKCGDVHLDQWYNAENIIVEGNIFEHPLKNPQYIKNQSAK